MRYIMLSDSEKVAGKTDSYYDASWLGMAIAYRDYLTEKGIISKLKWWILLIRKYKWTLIILWLEKTYTSWVK
jgi:hypothetical protein